MAIQLSDRDMMIFKFIEEHHVLLEKHIAWFISSDEKPVLIRDRLRKLFYLDYLQCQRHGGKLPWWTTPTKPLVYMLSPMARTIVRAGDTEVDLQNDDLQRHLLEVANLRMLFLMDQKAGQIQDFAWHSVAGGGGPGICANVSFKRNGTIHSAGIINHPSSADEILKTAGNCQTEMIWVICRDDAHMTEMQKAVVGSAIACKTAFTTHQEIYKSGIVKCKWQSANKQFAPVVTDAVAAESIIAPLNLTPGMAPA